MKSYNWFDFVRVDNTRHSHRSSSYSPIGDNRDRLSGINWNLTALSPFFRLNSAYRALTGLG